MSIVEYIPRAITRRLKNTYAELFYWRLQVLLSDDVTTEVTVNNQRFEITIPENAGSWFPEKYADVDYEPTFFNSLNSVIKDNSVYYDVGSRWGLCVKTACRMGVPEENIHAFEAHPMNNHYLLSNTTDLRIKHTRAFVSNNDSDDALTLDSYTESNPDPTIVKIDVEGAELQVLSGMNRLISSVQPILFIEVHPGLMRSMNDSQFDLLDRVESAGYEVKVTNHRSNTDGWDSLNKRTLPEKGDYMIWAQP